MDHVFYSCDRDSVISGLCELVDFLKEHPSLPVAAVSLNLFTRKGVGDVVGPAAVDVVAGILEQPAQALGGDHYVVERRFGAVSYAAVHVPDEQDCGSDAMSSDRDWVEPLHEVPSDVAA